MERIRRERDDEFAFYFHCVSEADYENEESESDTERFHEEKEIHLIH